MSAHPVRPALLALLLAPAAALALAGPATAQVTSPDTTRFNERIEFRIDPARPCMNDSLRLTVLDHCAPCVGIQSFAHVAGDPLDDVFQLVLDAQPAAQCAAESCATVQASAWTGTHAASTYAQMVVYVSVNLPPDSLNPSGGQVHFIRSWHYAVSDTCSIVPDFLQDVRVLGALAMCDTCPPAVVAGVPLQVALSGVLPDGCWSYEGARVVPAESAIGQPTIGVYYRHRVGAACSWNASSFADTVLLPGSPPGRHPFVVRQVAANTLDSSLVTVEHTYWFVARDTPIVVPVEPPTCVWPFLEPIAPVASTADSPGCTLSLFPGGTGTVEFGVRSDSLPLAGIQGSLHASPGLRMSGVHPVGPAAGMHLVLQPDGAGGVGFVLYADQGAPIPVRSPGTPIFEVTVAADSGLHGGETGYVNGGLTAASDSLARSLSICPIMTLRLVAATVCIEPPTTCDFNGDDRTDVADLVGMARCWNDPAACADSGRHGPDCTGDGAFHLDDILCCARTILGGGSRDTTSHAASRLQVSFGAAQVSGDRVRVSLVIRGATEMSGALLRVRFPGDRYVADAPTADPVNAARGTSASWLPLTERGTDDVLVGVLRLDDATQDEVTVPLEFVLKPGQAAGGTLSVDQGRIVAPDGSTLTIDLGQIVGSLPATGPGEAFTRVELLAGPNPSSGRTNFTVRLPAAGLVDLSVYDLAGRRVASVWHGSMDAGEHPLTWNGPAARQGMYFARLSVNGVVRTRRVLLQPGS